MIEELLGNTVLEAMASGLPAIVSDWDGMRDLVEKDATGALIPTWWMPCCERQEALSPVEPLLTGYLLQAQSVWVDTNLLTAELKAMLASRELREWMGQAGRARAERCFAWPVILNRWHTLWREQLAMAAEELPSAAQVRRDGALALGLPTPLLRLFGHYATRIVDTARQTVRLTELGRAAATRREQLLIYADIAPMLRPGLVEAVLTGLMRVGARGVTIDDLCRAVADHCGVAEDDVRFVVALLLKRDMIQVREAGE